MLTSSALKRFPSPSRLTATEWQRHISRKVTAWINAVESAEQRPGRARPTPTRTPAPRYNLRSRAEGAAAAPASMNPLLRGGKRRRSPSPEARAIGPRTRQAKRHAAAAAQAARTAPSVGPVRSTAESSGTGARRMRSISFAATDDYDLASATTARVNKSAVIARSRASRLTRLQSHHPALLFNPCELRADAHPGWASMAVPPAVVRALRLLDAAVAGGVGTIPWALAPLLTGPAAQASEPPEFFPDFLFAARPAGAVDGGTAPALLAKALTINASAREVGVNGAESDWMDIARDVMLVHRDLAMLQPASHAQRGLQLKNVTADSINSLFLPLVPDRSAPMSLSKVDLALAIVLGKIPSRDMQQHFSATLTITGRQHVVLMPVEVKSMHGLYGDGLYQTTVFSAAMLISWHQLHLKVPPSTPGPTTAAAEFPPIPAIVTMGYDWFLHWSYWHAQPDSASPKATGTIVTLGPYHIGSTMTIRGTLKLLDILRRLNEWIMAEWVEYDDGTRARGIWPMLRDMVHTLDEGTTPDP
ncbi:hypothetical protein DFH27DRAFT_52109 [Peziza echinospora]|nr:hypothetical protein DFH27DRAFT_52109 [Peziza echinospora]